MPDPLELPRQKPDLRSPVDRLHRTVNGQQRKLVQAYDIWAKRVYSELARAQARGVTQIELSAILERHLAMLETTLIDITGTGLAEAQKLVLRRRLAPAGLDLLLRQRLIESRLIFADSLVPSMRRSLLGALATQDSQELQTTLIALRSRPAAYAGGYWAMAFETQGAVIKAKDKTTGESTRGRWGLDPPAEHCSARPADFGCPEIAGE